MPPGVGVHLIRILRKERNEGYPLVAGKHHPHPISALPAEDLTGEAGLMNDAICPSGIQFSLHSRRNERKTVNLAMGMGHRHADLGSPILEDEHVPDDGDGVKSL